MALNAQRFKAGGIELHTHRTQKRAAAEATALKLC
jgi:hypothetical protein